jgi:uncharacterized protein (DUF1684 family)
MKTLNCILGALAVMVTSCSGDAEVADIAKSDYTQEIEDWRTRRVDRLKSETGWLTVVGLLPLEQGANSFGSAPDNDLVFPVGAPDHAGVITLDGDKATLEVTQGVTVIHDSTAITTADMIPDTEDSTVVLEMNDRFTFYHIVRVGKHYVRLKDREALALKQFGGEVPAWPVNVAWRIEARWEEYDEPKNIVIPNIQGYVDTALCTGAAIFDWNGETHILEPDDRTDEYLFFVFGDLTNEHETYGGGRFYYADPPDSNGIVVLDFNKCYNPPCVFTHYATCAIPRPENKLDLRIEAGEKMIADELH